MAIDITNIIKSLQEKIGAANTTNSTPQDLIYMMETAKLIDDGCVVETYANTDVFPAASGSKRLAFDELNRTLYLNNGSEWKQYDVTVPDAPSSYTFQGSNYGYATGGYPNGRDVIEKFSFSSDGNATDVGNLAVQRYIPAGQTSHTYGYATGGGPGTSSAIQKYSFSVDGNASNIASLSVARSAPAGQSSETYGYTSGGGNNTIDKFPFASDTDGASDVGDLTTTSGAAAGQSTTDYGYYSIGTTIDKFSFSSDGNATDVGNLTSHGTNATAGQSSTDYGYTCGGQGSNVIDKFPFASDGNATDVGDLTTGVREGSGGQSSTGYGYVTGGRGDPTGTSVSNVIDKFPFSSDANATDIGDLTVTRGLMCGSHY